MVRARMLGGCVGFLLMAPGRVACQHPKDPSPLSLPATSPDPYATILHTSNSGIHGAERTVIADSVAWAQMWGRLMAMHPFPPPRPPVDFNSSLVIVAASGERAAGTSIRIDSTRLLRDELVVYVRQSSSGVGCMGDMMIRYPAHAIQVRRRDKPVRFVNDSIITSKC